MTRFYKVLIIVSFTINIIFIALGVLHYSEFRLVKLKTQYIKRDMALEQLKLSQEISTDTNTSIESIRSDMKQEIDVIKSVVKRLNKQIMENPKKDKK